MGPRLPFASFTGDGKAGRAQRGCCGAGYQVGTPVPVRADDGEAAFSDRIPEGSHRWSGRRTAGPDAAVSAEAASLFAADLHRGDGHAAHTGGAPGSAGEAARG